MNVRVSKRVKQALLVTAIMIGFLLMVVTAYYASRRATYLSEEPLYGSFRIDPPPCGRVYPADFLVSVNVKTSDRTLLKCAEESGIDLSKGCWVYSFAENKVFRGEKRQGMLLAYEGNHVIGRFEYTASDFLGFAYDEQYKARWRGTELTLNKTLKGFVFP